MGTHVTLEDIIEGTHISVKDALVGTQVIVEDILVEYALVGTQDTVKDTIVVIHVTVGYPCRNPCLLWQLLLHLQVVVQHGAGVRGGRWAGSSPR